MFPRPPGSTLFPYTTLFRSRLTRGIRTPLGVDPRRRQVQAARPRATRREEGARIGPGTAVIALPGANPTEDRKSTRLNSSHPSISYAVFCLKKKKKKQNKQT